MAETHAAGAPALQQEARAPQQEKVLFSNEEPAQPKINQ